MQLLGRAAPRLPQHTRSVLLLARTRLPSLLQQHARIAAAAAGRTCPTLLHRTQPASHQRVQQQPLSSPSLVLCRSYSYGADGGWHDDDDDNDDWSGSDVDTSDEDEEADEPYMAVHHVHQRLPLKTVALGDDGDYVVSYEDGDMAWSELSDGVYEALRKSHQYRKAVATVALGRNEGSNSYSMPGGDPGEVWFLRRETGTTYLGDACTQELRQTWDSEGGDHVVQVAFAPSNGWFVSRQNGSCTWTGLPSSLQETLDESFSKEGGVKSLSVGHNGEWFCLFNSGSLCWQGVHPALARVLRSGLGGGRSRGAVEWVELGPDGTFVALFANHTMWLGDQDLTHSLLSCM